MIFLLICHEKEVFPFKVEWKLKNEEKIPYSLSKCQKKVRIKQERIRPEVGEV